jgi:hypothetical protein
MLMQPSWVREFCQTTILPSVNEFLHQAYTLADTETDSIFSMDYLLYGLNAIDRYPEKTLLVRWCNVSRSRQWIDLEHSSVEILERKLPFKSVSFHSWQA